jgi:uncharacterized protein YeeX (DUF496 family)
MEISIKCNEEELRTIIKEANIFKEAVREINGNSRRISEMGHALLLLQQKIREYIRSEVTYADIKKGAEDERI